MKSKRIQVCCSNFKVVNIAAVFIVCQCAHVEHSIHRKLALIKSCLKNIGKTIEHCVAVKRVSKSSPQSVLNLRSFQNLRASSRSNKKSNGNSQNNLFHLKPPKVKKKCYKQSSIILVTNSTEKTQKKQMAQLIIQFLALSVQQVLLSFLVFSEFSLQIQLQLK